MSHMKVPCLENIFGLKEATPDECCSALPSTVQRNFRTPFMYIKVKDTEGMSHRVPCTIWFNPMCPSRHSIPQCWDGTRNSVGHVTLSHRVPWHTGTVDGHRTHCKIDNGLFQTEFRVAVLHSADSSSSAH